MTQNTDTLPKPDVSAAPSSGTSSGPSPAPDARPAPPKLPKEIGGPAGPEPTRYGDWEQKGRCTDF